MNFLKVPITLLVLVLLVTLSPCAVDACDSDSEVSDFSNSDVAELYYRGDSDAGKPGKNDPRTKCLNLVKRNNVQFKLTGDHLMVCQAINTELKYKALEMFLQPQRPVAFTDFQKCVAFTDVMEESQLQCLSRTRDIVLDSFGIAQSTKEIPYCDNFLLDKDSIPTLDFTDGFEQLNGLSVKMFYEKYTERGYDNISRCFDVLNARILNAQPTENATQYFAVLETLPRFWPVKAYKVCDKLLTVPNVSITKIEHYRIAFVDRLYTSYFKDGK